MQKNRNINILPYRIDFGVAGNVIWSEWWWLKVNFKFCLVPNNLTTREIRYGKNSKSVSYKSQKSCLIAIDIQHQLVMAMIPC